MAVKRKLLFSDGAVRPPQAYVDMLQAKEQGMDNVASRASAIIGPTSFRHWAEEELKPAIAH